MSTIGGGGGGDDRTPQQPKRELVAPNAPRRAKRARRRRDDDEDLAVRLPEQQMRTIEQLTMQPIGFVALLLSRGGGGYIEPERLIAYLRRIGYPVAADIVKLAIHQEGFWWAMVRRCFPAVTEVPPHILVETNDPAFTPPIVEYGANNERRQMSREEVAWQRTLRYILAVVSSIEVSVEARGAVVDQVLAFDPPLVIDEQPNASPLTCNEYVETMHRMRYTYSIDPNPDDNDDFSLTINVSDRANSDGFDGSDDDDDDSEFDNYQGNKLLAGAEVPSLARMNALDDNYTLAEMRSRRGVVVHNATLSFHPAYAHVIDPSMRVRWRLPQSRMMDAHTTRAVVSNLIDAIVDVYPWRVDNRFLWSVSTRQQQPLNDAVHRERLPVHIVLVDRRTERVVFEFDELERVRANTLVYSVDETLGGAPAQYTPNSLSAIAYNQAIDVGGIDNPVIVNWTIDSEWSTVTNSDNDYEVSGVTSMRLRTDWQRRLRPTMAEVVGPPRRGRPIDAREPHAQFYRVRSAPTRINVRFEVEIGDMFT